MIPVYNEEKNIEEVYSRTKIVLSSLSLPYEVIFVDDGSSDATYTILRGIQSKDSCVKIIKLDNNYGQLYALLAGFAFVKGETIITMDCDLQNDPRDIPLFLAKIKEGFDFVNGWRQARKDPITRKLISGFANWLIGTRTGVRLHDYGCAFTAIKKKLIDKLKHYGKDARFIKPLLVCLTDSTAEIKVSHHLRQTGRSKYSLVKIIKSGMDFLLNFTVTPRDKIEHSYNIKEVIDG